MDIEEQTIKQRAKRYGLICYVTFFITFWIVLAATDPEELTRIGDWFKNRF
jgi:hypothetical protein